ncbi:MAG: carotenoid biosynthesis protein [Acidimicrobiia bacterium]|nr:carotenoid biosynthesis protein [Acidimicrobiia bacterium]
MGWSIGHVSIPVGDVTVMGPLLSGTLTPEWSFLGVELLVYVFAYLCLRDAMQTGRAYVAAFFATILFTLIVESLLSANTKVYEYPAQSFLIQVINVPLWVPVGWAFILYAVMATSTLLGVPIHVAALIDAFLALNLDLTLDPVAIHRGWWTWHAMENYPYATDYFGIPVINFMGWFVIVAAFSFFVRLGRTKVPPGSRGVAGDVVPPLLAVIPALVTVMAYQLIGMYMMERSGVQYNGALWSTIVLLVCAFIATRHIRRFRRDAPFRKLFVTVPLAFHGYFFALLFVTRAKPIPPAVGGEWLFVTVAELAIFFPVVAALGLVLYFWPYIDDLAVPGPPAVKKEAART